VIGLFPTAADGSYDLTAYRVVFALQGHRDYLSSWPALLISACTIPSNGLRGNSVRSQKVQHCLLSRLAPCAMRCHIVAVR
jgi:hypothetical protein